MDNFEKDVLVTKVESQNADSDSIMPKNIVVCLPRTKIEEVEVYLRSRNIENFDTCFNLNEFSDTLLENDQSKVYIFDFIGETRIRDILLHNKDKVPEIWVFTNKENTASTMKQLTDNVFILDKLVDILTLFWDSDVFSYDNVITAYDNGIELVNKRALEIQGKSLSNLELKFSIEAEKSKYSGPIKYINIEKKFQGKDIGKHQGSFVKRIISNFISGFKKDVFEEDYDSEEQLYSNEQMEFMEGSNVYRLENDKIKEITGKLRSTIVSSMSEFLLSKNIIDEETKRQIDHLKDMNQLSGIFGEVDYVVSLGIIDEVTSINLVNDYYTMYCKQYDDVMHSVVLLDEFKFEGCLEFKCFCTRGMRRDVTYVIIDPDNEYGKNKIESMFNNFEYVFTKEKYIIDKLKRMQGGI